MPHFKLGDTFILKRDLPLKYNIDDDDDQETVQGVTGVAVKIIEIIDSMVGVTDINNPIPHSPDYIDYYFYINDLKKFYPEGPINTKPIRSSDKIDVESIICAFTGRK